MENHDQIRSGSDENNSQSSSDTTEQLLRVLMVKMDSMENTLIKLLVKVDNYANTRQNDRTSNRNSPGEIDISALKVLGLPAESQKEIDKLEDNLKNEVFKQKLVSQIGFHFELFTIQLAFVFFTLHAIIVHSTFFIYLFLMTNACVALCRESIYIRMGSF